MWKGYQKVKSLPFLTSESVRETLNKLANLAKQLEQWWAVEMRTTSYFPFSMSHLSFCYGFNVISCQFLVGWKNKNFLYLSGQSTNHSLSHTFSLGRGRGFWAKLPRWKGSSHHGEALFLFQKHKQHLSTSRSWSWTSTSSRSLVTTGSRSVALPSFAVGKLIE